MLIKCHACGTDIPNANGNRKYCKACIDSEARKGFWKTRPAEELMREAEIPLADDHYARTAPVLTDAEIDAKLEALRQLMLNHGLNGLRTD